MAAAPGTSGALYMDASGGAWSTVVYELDSEAISPELVLVCPELRSRALAQLPDRHPDGWIPPRFSTIPAAPVPTTAPAPPDELVEAEATPIPLRGRALVVAAAAYAAQSATSAAVMGAKIVAGTAALAGLADVLHH